MRQSTRTFATQARMPSLNHRGKPMFAATLSRKGVSPLMASFDSRSRWNASELGDEALSIGDSDKCSSLIALRVGQEIGRIIDQLNFVVFTRIEHEDAGLGPAIGVVRIEGDDFHPQRAGIARRCAEKAAMVLHR